MNCVRKIPGCHSGPPARGPASRSAASRPIAQGAGVTVKAEKNESPPVTAANQWIQPPLSPNSPDQSGSSSTNVHLSRLMRLMEEIPAGESSSSSRSMYSIAIGHSVVRRADRSTYLSYYNDDGTFQADLNDNTIASVDSAYSDDTSWSSDNVDPAYSAIDGLQKVVSEFADVAAVSPLVAVAAPSATQEGPEPKTREPVTGCSSHTIDHAKGSQRGTAVKTASACSAENGNASYAALCGLQKVVCGFKEQACVSPFSAVRGTPQHNPGQRESPARKCFPAVEEESPCPQGSSPSPGSRFLLEGPWLPRMDSSYSALSDLQKVVNGFSDLGCISPFSAVSTATSESTVETSSQKRSEQPALGSALTGLGTRDSLSPGTKTHNPASMGKPEPTVRRAQTEAPPPQGSHQISHKAPPGSSSHCIDLTLEDEPAGPKPRIPSQGKPRVSQELRRGHTQELPTSRAVKPPGVRARPPASRQLIDLTEEEDVPARPRAPSAEAARGSAHSVFALSGAPHQPLSTDRRLRPSLTAAKVKRVGVDRPLDPGPSRTPRGGVSAVNEHISSLEKLLKGVPTFTPPSNPSGPQPSASWWFKSTSPHET